MFKKETSIGLDHIKYINYNISMSEKFLESVYIYYYNECDGQPFALTIEVGQAGLMSVCRRFKKNEDLFRFVNSFGLDAISELYYNAKQM